MAKHRKKKPHSGNMDVALSYRIDSLPKGTVSKKEFFMRTKRFITHGEDLPAGWKITLRWRNAKNAAWREDRFENAINDSRPGFNKLVLRRLRRDEKK